MSLRQRGGFVLGLVAGLLIGLSLALGVALYITKAPVPFVNKVPQRTAEQDQAEQERNRSWDPNAPLAGKAARAAAAASAPAGVASAAATAALPASAASAPRTASPTSNRDPAAILAGAGAPAASTARGADSFQYFVQAGAYTRAEEAEQQRARIGLLGQTAKVTEREQQGRTVYRVRLGPFETRGEADTLLGKLQEQSIEGQLVRVERP